MTIVIELDLTEEDLQQAAETDATLVSFVDFGGDEYRLRLNVEHEDRQ